MILLTPFSHLPLVYVSIVASANNVFYTVFTSILYRLPSYTRNQKCSYSYFPENTEDNDYAAIRVMWDDKQFEQLCGKISIQLLGMPLYFHVCI